MQSRILRYSLIIGKLRFIISRSGPGILSLGEERKPDFDELFQFSGPVFSFAKWKFVGTVPDLTSYSKKV